MLFLNYSWSLILVFSTSERANLQWPRNSSKEQESTQLLVEFSSEFTLTPPASSTSSYVTFTQSWANSTSYSHDTTTQTETSRRKTGAVIDLPTATAPFFVLPPSTVKVPLEGPTPPSIPRTTIFNPQTAPALAIRPSPSLDSSNESVSTGGLKPGAGPNLHEKPDSSRGLNSGSGHNSDLFEAPFEGLPKASLDFPVPLDQNSRPESCSNSNVKIGTASKGGANRESADGPDVERSYSHPGGPEAISDSADEGDIGGNDPSRPDTEQSHNHVKHSGGGLDFSGIITNVGSTKWCSNMGARLVQVTVSFWALRFRSIH